MAKFAEAEARLYKNIFVCKRTKKKVRADPQRVQQGKVRARGDQGTRKLRPKRKK